MARPAKWNAPTTSIRVPEHAVDQLLDLAKLLDQDQGFVRNPDHTPKPKPKTFLVSVDEKRYLVTGDATDPRLDPLFADLERKFKQHDFEDDQWSVFLALLVEELARRKMIRLLKA